MIRPLPMYRLIGIKRKRAMCRDADREVVWSPQELCHYDD